MATKKRRVLVVDDDAAVRRSIRKVLEGAGYEVATAADGQDAVIQFAPEHIDLVLLDLNLPVRSGWDVFERLTTQYPFVPIIIVTGLPDQYQTALAAGVGALMEKPIDVATLFRTMGELLVEPKAARLRRLCGYQQDIKHLPPPGVHTYSASH
jgi:CheY-like chemotaxis protein